MSRHRWAASKLVRALCCSLLAAVLTATPALANDATFGGAGADLVPLAEQRVQMKSEDVRLTSRGHEWLIEATYVFYNPGESVKVQVGFPEYRCEEGFDCNNVAFRDLETTVGGVKVEHRQGKLEKGSGWEDFLGVVWLFDVEFPAAQELTIRHQYRLASGGNVEGSSFTSYVTRTGRGWAGPIGRAQFTAILPPYARVVFDPKIPGLTAAAPRLITTGGEPRVELTLSGKNWKPQGGLHFAFNGSARLSPEPIDVAKLARERELPMVWSCSPGQDVDEAQRCLNELYAAKGYPFKNKAIAQRYYGGNPRFRKVDLGDRTAWVRDASPLAAFSPSWFSSGEAQDIIEWTQLIARARSAESGSTKTQAAGSSAELPLPADPNAGAAAPSQPEPVAAAGAPNAAQKELESNAEPRARVTVSDSKEPTSAAGSSATLSNSPGNVPAQAARCGCRVPGRSHPSPFGWFCAGFVLLSLSRRARPRSALL